MIVDWEYAGMGHPWFDLGNLSVNNDFDEATDERLLPAYHGGSPERADARRCKLMRVLSDVREGAWGSCRHCVSDLDFDFDGYAATSISSGCGQREPRASRSWLSAAGG